MTMDEGCECVDCADLDEPYQTKGISMFPNDSGQAMEKLCNVPMRNPTITESLVAERERLRARLNDITDAIAAIEAHPETQKALDAIARLGNYR